MDTFKAGDEFTMLTGTVSPGRDASYMRGNTLVVAREPNTYAPHPGHPIDEHGRSCFTIKIVE